MRIISGKYRGLEIKGYNIDGTRPTMDRVKESLFGMIQNYLKESICLDLFAGSGALGIEALSMGASLTYFVDNNKVALSTLEDNLKRLKIKEDYKLILDDYLSVLDSFKDKIKFDIIFLDPPYHKNMMNKAIEKIIEYNLLNENGIIVCEYEEGEVICNLTLLKYKKYGSKNISIYKK